jgi:hypothetical protein
MLLVDSCGGARPGPQIRERFHRKSISKKKKKYEKSSEIA